MGNGPCGSPGVFLANWCVFLRLWLLLLQSGWELLRHNCEASVNRLVPGCGLLGSQGLLICWVQFPVLGSYQVWEFANEATK